MPIKKIHYLCIRNNRNGALVQLVRIRACHARGQGFESPTHRRVRRNKPKSLVNGSFYKAFVVRGGCRIRPPRNSGCLRRMRSAPQRQKAVAGINSGKSHPAPLSPAYSTRRTKQASLTLGPSPAVQSLIRNAFDPKWLKSYVENIDVTRRVPFDCRFAPESTKLV